VVVHHRFTSQKRLQQIDGQTSNPLLVRRLNNDDVRQQMQVQHSDLCLPVGRRTLWDTYRNVMTIPYTGVRLSCDRSTYLSSPFAVPLSLDLRPHATSTEDGGPWRVDCCGEWNSGALRIFLSTVHRRGSEKREDYSIRAEA